MSSLPRRKLLRLQEYNYSLPGAYFVTICTVGRRPLLSRIFVGQGLAPAEVHLSAYGLIAQNQLLDLPARFPNLQIDKYVIMPNHIHILMSLHSASDKLARSSVADVVRAYKSLTTRACKQHKPIPRLFQSSYYDHVVRGKEDYDAIWEYIDNNPAQWLMDRYHIG